MGVIRNLFATSLYEASLADEPNFASFNADIESAAWSFADDDRAGQAWCEANGYGGYTSYASLNDLPTRVPAFGDLKRRLDKHVALFADSLAFDLGPKGKLRLDSLWVSILEPDAAHSGHIHPHSVISGTVYIATPPGSGGLRLEDPRLGLMMAAPPLRKDTPDAQGRFVTLTPSVGTVFMWESWLRHEVLPNQADQPRISASFNYAWG